MNAIEIISGILLILSCIVIIVLVMMQDSDTSLSGAIGGGSSDSFYGKNKSRSQKAVLARATKVAAAALFVVTLVVNFVNLLAK